MDNVLAVASITALDERSGFSEWGLTSVDVAAPGALIYSTFPENAYRSISSTSLATPQVGGVVALMRAQNPGLTAIQMKQRLMETVTKLPLQETRVTIPG